MWQASFSESCYPAVSHATALTNMTQTCIMGGCPSLQRKRLLLQLSPLKSSVSAKTLRHRSGRLCKHGFDSYKVFSTWSPEEWTALWFSSPKVTEHEKEKGICQTTSSLRLLNMKEVDADDTEYSDSRGAGLNILSDATWCNRHCIKSCRLVWIFTTEVLMSARKDRPVLQLLFSFIFTNNNQQQNKRLS